MVHGRHGAQVRHDRVQVLVGHVVKHIIRHHGEQRLVPGSGRAHAVLDHALDLGVRAVREARLVVGEVAAAEASAVREPHEAVGAREVLIHEGRAHLVARRVAVRTGRDMVDQVLAACDQVDIAAVTVTGFRVGAGVFSGDDHVFVVAGEAGEQAGAEQKEGEFGNGHDDGFPGRCMRPSLGVGSRRPRTHAATATGAEQAGRYLATRSVPQGRAGAQVVAQPEAWR